MRAWRGLRFNEKQAAKLKQKLERKQAKEKERLKAEAAKKAAAPQGNPFSVGYVQVMRCSYIHPTVGIRCKT